MMRLSVRDRVFAALVLVGLAVQGGRGEGEVGAGPPAAAEIPSARAALEPAAPPLPAEVVSDLQQGDFGRAVAALEALAAREEATAGDRAYLALIRGTALRLAGRLDDARAALDGAMAAAPGSPWAVKLRSALAEVEVAARRFEAAERLARADAEALLDPARKDRLAGVYRAFADRLLHPAEPTTPPDPEGAHALLEPARSLAKGKTLRAALLLDLARASRAAGNHARAIGEYERYLEENPEGTDRIAARFELGEAQLDAGQPLPARRTWQDLARDLADAEAKPARDARARSLFMIARTYGFPAPPDDASLDLGIASLRRLLATEPAHPLAVRAAFEIGAADQHRGRSPQAVEALSAFLAGKGFEATTDDARKEQAERRMTATFLLGQILQGQEKFDEAIAAWRGYLGQFPNGPQSADAQRAILDTKLLIAQDFLRREQYAKARAAWEAFAAESPLDPRVPQVLFQVGESFAAEEEWDEAIAAWEALAGKFPGSEPAAHGRFLIATIYEDEKGKPAEAIERFKAVEAEPWQSRAKARIAVMEAKSLTVVTPRTFRSGETAALTITSRNLETLTFTAYRLDAEAYFRKKHALGGVEALDIGLVAPDAEWTAEVPGFEKFKPIDHQYNLKVDVPGVYVVKVSDEATLQATTLVLGSDLDAIVKASKDQVLVFAQDMKTGKGRAGARVLVAGDDKVILEAKTGEDGVLLHDLETPLAPGAALRYLVLDGPDAAGSGLGVPQQVAQGLSARAYLATDRPAYRPGQDVQIRGVVREVEGGQYAIPPGAEYRLEVLDSRGRRFVARPVSLSGFGTFHESFPLDPSSPVGTYRIHLFRPGKSDFSGSFEVQAYRLEKADLEVRLPRTVYFRGETIAGDVVAVSQFGTPMAGRPVTVALPDGRTIQGTTDAQGTFHFTVETAGFAEEQALRIVAQLPEEGVAAAAAVRLAVRAFRIDLHTGRDVYLAGESFPLDVTTLDAQGEPTGQRLTLAVLKRIARAGRVAEREVSTREVTTDKETGQATTRLQVEDAEGGPFVVRVSGTDRFGNAVVADRELTISGEKDETKLRLLSDRAAFKVGETAAVDLHSRGGGGTALLAWEADRILSYRVVALEEGSNRVAWEVAAAQAPNVSLTAARMAGSRFDRARLDLDIERDLRVTVTPAKDSVGPGEEVAVDVVTTDPLGRPARAEVALALVDRALLRLHGDRLPPIGPFFHGQTRTGAFTTEATNTFRYAPATVPVPSAVVEEAERLAAVAADQLGRERLDEAAKRELSLGEATTPPAGAPASSVAAGAGVDGVYRQFPSQLSAGRSVLSNEPAGLGGMSAYYSDKEDFDAKAFGAVEAEGARDARFSLGFAFQMPDRQAGRGRGEPALTREQFVETAYWNPAVVTGEDGRARVTFKAPTALSRYRFTARGTTGADTLVGQATADLAVRQDFFVELKAPAALTQGDSPRFAARLHHTGVAGKAAVRLTVYAGGREVVDPREVELKGDGIEELLFDPFEVPDGDSVRLTLAASAGEAADELVVEVPVRPWGVQATASASGTSRDDATAIVTLPPGRHYEEPEMLVVLSPSIQRLLVELALGHDAVPLADVLARRLPVPLDTTADRASALLAATSVLRYLTEVGGAAAPEAARLSDRVQGLVAELVTLQNEDGGWPWVAPRDPNQPAASDPMTSARVAIALRGAQAAGLLPEPAASEKAAAYLAQAFAKAGASDYETRAALLHALGAWEKATFEQANSLNRARQDLPDAALADLALAFVHLRRPELAGEVLGVLGPRSKTESAGPGQPARRYWTGSPASAWCRGPAEATALAAWAFARARPDADELAGAVAWLLAHRAGPGWQPPVARGPALAALATYHGGARSADDRYRLVVTVNDEEVFASDIVGTAEGRAIRVPRRMLKLGDANRVRFDIEGRGTFGYAVTLSAFTRDFGPDQDPNRPNRPFRIDRRVYTAAEPQLDGKTLPSGFSTAVGAHGFENLVTQVPPGGRARVQIQAARRDPAGQPAWEREFLVLEEHLPAGTTLVEGSIQTTAAHHTLADGVLTAYFAPDGGWPSLRYEVFGYLPGRYRALPPILSSAYEPGRRHLGPIGSLQVLAPGEPSTDPYKPTPDELYARGKALFDAGKAAEAAAPLEALWSAYTLRDDVAKDAARMLLTASIQSYAPRKIVPYFEVLKEKAPELVIPFDDIRVVGRAYRDIGEPERAYLVWRAVAEASYLEDARIGELLRQRGRALEGVAYLIGLWSESPDSASIQADLFGLSQVLTGLAGRATTDPAVRRALADAGATRSDLLLQAIRLTRAFLARSPRGPLADEASLALVGAFLDLEDYESVVALARRYAGLYPKSSYLDSFQYAEALGRFHLGEYDRAIEVAEAIAAATYRGDDGAEHESPNKWQALYILGQIYDARHRPARAVSYYERVADRFTDAALAVRDLTRKALSLPEVTVVRPGAGEGRRPSVELTSRNLAEVEVKVYPVDLMRLYLSRRSLDQIAGIDLAGIRPLVETTVELGDGADFEETARGLDLPLEKEGAYLVMARGGDLYASGIVLVTPLEVAVQEDAGAGRVRVTVRDAQTKDFAPRAQVKVIGTANAGFLGGPTDLRGVAVVEGVRGVVTAVARRGPDQYAFYRGTTPVGAPPPAEKPVEAKLGVEAGQPAAPSQALDENLREQNAINNLKQLDRLQNRLQAPGAAGVQVQGVQ